jgi:hypothetical protein
VISVSDEGMTDPTITGCLRKPLRNIAQGPRILRFFNIGAASAEDSVIGILGGNSFNLRSQMLSRMASQNRHSNRFTATD